MKFASSTKNLVFSLCFCKFCKKCFSEPLVSYSYLLFSLVLTTIFFFCLHANLELKNLRIIQNPELTHLF